MIMTAYILVIFAFALIMSDFFIFSFGVLTSISAILFVIASVIIFTFSPMFPDLFAEIILPAYVALFIFIVIFIILGYKANKTKVKSSIDSIANTAAFVTKDIPAGGFGQIDLNGEIWTAYADVAIDKGQKVIVVESPHSSSVSVKDSLKLKVKPYS